MLDVIIIGAGLGGLIAAARLMQAGKSVLVVEKNTHIGGTAYVYRRNGFTFPMGPLGFSNPQKIRSILHSLDDDSIFNCHRVHYCLWAFDRKLMLSLSFNEMVKELSASFPSETQAIKQFFYDIDNFVSSTDCCDANTAARSTDKSYRISIEEYLNKITTNWRLQYILGSLGTNKPYASFPLQTAMWNLMCKEGIWYPDGGFEGFSNKLARLLTTVNNKVSQHDKGKQNNSSGLSKMLKLGVSVEKIQVDHNRVSGIILSDGTAIRSNSVISNADYKSTFLSLLGTSIPFDLYDIVSDAKQAGSMLQVCLGIDVEKVDLSAFAKATRVIYRRDDNTMPQSDMIERYQKEINPDEIARQEIEVSCLSKDDEKLASDGKAVIVIRTEASYEYFSRYKISMQKRIPEYYDYKNRIASALINEVEKIIPGLSNSILVTDIATPLTFEDQGSRSQGAVAGWSWDYKDWDGSGFRELILTPIRGLYMAGYQAFSALSMGGVPTAIISGYLAAEAVLKNADPISDMRILNVLH